MQQLLSLNFHAIPLNISSNESQSLLRMESPCSFAENPVCVITNDYHLNCPDQIHIDHSHRLQQSIFYHLVSKRIKSLFATRKTGRKLSL